jgi:murein DD-endopeptidase MepM/ murein hydrolase activator NlpD
MHRPAALAATLALFLAAEIALPAPAAAGIARPARAAAEIALAERVAAEIARPARAAAANALRARAAAAIALPARAATEIPLAERAAAAIARPARAAPGIARPARAAAANGPSSETPVVAWAWPVRGAVLRAFFFDPADPFRRGRRRGVDIAAPAGAPVRAACGGRVVTARPGWVVTLRCGPWRVTHLPMAAVAVRVGDHVAAGRRLGTLGARRGRRGLHLGVRLAGDRFGYVDPLAFLPPDRPPRLGPLPPGTIARRPHPALRPAPPPLRAVPQPPRPAPPPLGAAPPPLGAAPPPLRAAPPPLRPAPPPLRAAPRPPAPVRRVRVPGGGGLAPWPAWAGLACALCGALGGGVRWRVRARRGHAPARAGEPVA